MFGKKKKSNVAEENRVELFERMRIKKVKKKKSDRTFIKNDELKLLLKYHLRIRSEPSMR